MRQKSPAELNSKTIRIHIDTYRILQSLSLRDNITMNEALTKLITGRLKPEPKPEPTQIPMPAFQLPGIPAAGVVPGVPAAGVTPGGVVAGVKIFPSIKLRVTVAGEEHTNGA